MEDRIHWEQKSNRLLSFLNLTLSIHLVIALFPVITFFLTISLTIYGNLKWLGFFFAVALSLIAFFIAREQFESILVRATLKYSIDDYGINFHYWMGNQRKILIPYESILKVSPVTLLEGSTNTYKLYFHLIPEINIKDYRVFTDDEFSLVHFDEIDDTEFVLQILNDKISATENFRNTDIVFNNFDRYKLTTSKFSFIMNILGIGYLCLGFYLLLICFDQKIFYPRSEVYTITNTEYIYGPDGRSIGQRVFTDKGYTFNVNRAGDIIGKKASIDISPVFGDIVKATLDGKQMDTANKNIEYDVKWSGMFLSSLLLFFCSAYIIHHGGVMAMADTSFFIIFPFVVLFIVYFI